MQIVGFPMGWLSYKNHVDCPTGSFRSSVLFIGILGPAPNIPMSPLMDMHLQLGLLCLVILDLKEKKELDGEVPDPLGKLRVPTLDEVMNFNCIINIM